MSHPHQLHATRAAHALADARYRLDTAVTRERAERRAEARITAAASAIQAWRPNPGPTGKGGHGDPASRAAVNHLEPEWRDGHLARLAASIDGTLHWLAASTTRRGYDDPLAHLQALARRIGPTGAHHLWRWLDEADQRIREQLHLDPDGQPLPGIRCPRCARRQLVAHTTGPRRTWTVTCVPECVCAGAGCPCGMTQPAASAPHVWGDGHPLLDHVLTSSNAA